MSRDGLLETGQFAVMSMIMINVHITTIYVQARFGSLNENCTNQYQRTPVSLSRLSMVAGASASQYCTSTTVVSLADGTWHLWLTARLS